MSSWRVVLTLALSAYVLWRNVPAAVLCLFPRLLRARSEDESWPKVNRELFDRMEEELAPLGFRRLGIHVERAPLRAGVVCYDFAHDFEHTWATATLQGSEGRLSLLTSFERGGFVLTADHRVLSQDRPGCLSGGIPGAQPEQLLAAHRRRVDRRRAEGETLREDLSLEARVNAADAWYRSCGAREVRVRNANGLVMTAVAVGISVMMIWAFGKAL